MRTFITIFFKRGARPFVYAFALFFALLAAGAVAAWTGPLSSPPGCTSGNPGCDAPINVSGNAQAKAAGLLLNTGGATNGLIVQYGNVGIGTMTPSAVDANASTFLTVDSGSNAGVAELALGKGQSGTSNFVGALDFYNGNISASEKRLSGIGGLTSGAINSGALVFFTNNAGSFAERMRIDNTGNVGIGVTPAAWNSVFRVMQVGNTAFGDVGANQDIAAMLGNAYYDGSTYRYLVNDYSAYFAANGTGGFTWFTAPSGTAGNAFAYTTQMTLTNAGNLGIGTAAPVASLDLVGNNSGVGVTGVAQRIRNNGTGDATLFFVNPNAANVVWSVGLDASDGGKFKISNDASLADVGVNTRLTIDATGNVTIAGSVTSSAFYYSSDARLKKDVLSVSPGEALADVLALNPVTYQWIDPSKGTGTQLGFIAQDVAKVVPELVHTDASSTLESVDYAKVTPLLVGAAQAQEQKIEALQQEVDQLKAEVEALKAAR